MEYIFLLIFIIVVFLTVNAVKISHDYKTFENSLTSLNNMYADLEAQVLPTYATSAGVDSNLTLTFNLEPPKVNAFGANKAATFLVSACGIKPSSAAFFGAVVLISNVGITSQPLFAYGLYSNDIVTGNAVPAIRVGSTGGLYFLTVTLDGSVVDSAVEIGSGYILTQKQITSNK
jgi:hypothetical protein